MQSAWDTYGNLYLTYLSGSVSNPTAYVVVLVSTDGGASFSALPPVSGKFADQPSIAVGPGCVWVSYTDPTNAIVAAGAPVSGLGQVGAFTSYVVPGSAGGDFGDIAVGPAGQVLVTYQYGLNSGAGPDTIAVNLNPTGIGGAFGAPATASATQVGGGHFVPAQSNTEGIDAEANLAWDRSGGPHTGRAYLAYTDAPDPASAATAIYARYSDDDGVTWSGAVRVTDDPGANSKFLPSISVDQTTGAVAVAWYDARNDNGQGPAGTPGDTNGVANDDAQLWMAVSADGGLSFGANVQVSAGTSNAAASEPAPAGYWNLGYGDFNKSDFRAGHFYLVWADNSNSTGDNPDGTDRRFDVYTADVTVTLLATPPAVTPPASPQAAREGVAQGFDLGSFSDPDGGPWAVDVNWGDGSPDVILQAGPGPLGLVTHTYAEEGSKTVTVTVTDAAGNLSDAVGFLVDVSDPAVRATAVALSAVRGAPLVGVTVATFTDPGGAEPNAGELFGVPYAAGILWGDGTASAGAITLDPATGVFSVTGDHTYATRGVFTVQVAVHHEAAPDAVVTGTACVAAAAIGLGPHDANTLLVGGTTGGDTIQVTQGKNGVVTVTVNGQAPGSFAGTAFSSIAVYGQTGDDVIQVDAAITRTAYLFGGAGDDQLQGGGYNVLVGGDGNDTLKGGKNRNIFIGGAGADIMSGLAGDDLLVAGRTDFEVPSTVASSQL